MRTKNLSSYHLLPFLATAIVMGALLLLTSCKKNNEEPPDDDSNNTQSNPLVLDFNFLHSLADSSTYGNHIDSVNSVNYSYSHDRNSVATHAINFGGTGYLRIPSSSSYKVDFPFTISMWVKLNDSSNVNNRLFYSDAHGTYYGYWIQTAGDGNIAFSFGNGGGSHYGTRNTVISSVQLNSNRWHHITGVFRGYNNIGVYIDGVQDINTVYSGDAEEIVYSNAFTNIGANSAVGSHLVGSVDNIRVWKKALSASEITAEYNRTE